MPEDKHKERAFYITHSGELLFWLVIILIVLFINLLFFVAKEKDNEANYRVFLPDVDGLIVGSPVRMMGVEVGHVTKIKPTGSEVYVKFIITQPDVYIPQGTVVTVEFSGMAASKSLELYLPDKNTYIDNSVPLMTVSPPKRLRDSLVLLGVMYKKIGSIIYGCSSFGNKLELDIDESVKPKGDINDFIKYANTYIDDVREKADGYRKSIEGFRKNVK